MRKILNVRGTQPEKPNEIEVNFDTVYLRTNISRIEEDEFVGWQYDEEQWNKDRFIEKVTKDKNDLNKTVVLLESENADLQLRLAQSTIETIEIMNLLNEQQKVEQAQSNAEMIELLMMMQGGM